MGTSIANRNAEHPADTLRRLRAHYGIDSRAVPDEQLFIAVFQHGDAPANHAALARQAYRRYLEFVEDGGRYELPYRLVRAIDLEYPSLCALAAR